MIIDENIYKLIKKEYIQDIECMGYVLEHNKTKALICLLENDDENKAFTIGFKTPPKDDTGVCHIIEHTVLAGSKKYPVKEPFLELMKSSLNTFLNAMTYPDRTIYPVSSCNKKDFENLMDIYLDAVFNPLIYQKEELFKQEGWHYELNDTNSDITINGIVYNEMKGAFSSADDLLYTKTVSALFKDNCYKYESGGAPYAIPDLTYQDFLNYHKNHYHPTNSIIVLYGNMDFKERLDYIDKEYLSKYDYLPNDFKVDSQKPFDKMIKLTDEYQLPQGLDINNKAYLSYAIAFNDDTPDIDLAAIDMINTVLFSINGAKIKSALIDQNIGSVVTSNSSFSTKQGFINVVVEEANENNADKFVEIIDENLRKIIKEKVNRKALEAQISKAEFSFKEKNFGRVSKGIYHAMTIIPNVLYGLDPFNRLNKEYIYIELRNRLNTNYFEEIIEKYFLNNNHKVLLVLNPSDTKQAEEDNLLKEKLDNYKNSLSIEELEKLVKDTKDILEYLQREDTKEDLATIPVLKLEDIDLNVDDIKNEETTLDNVSVLRHNYETNDIIYLDLLFKINNFNKDNYQSLGLFSDLIFSTSTKKTNYQDLSTELNINIGKFSTGIISVRKTNEIFFNVSLSILKNRFEKAINIVNDVFNNMIFSETNHNKELIQLFISSMETNFSYAGNKVASDYASASYDIYSYINNLSSGTDYYDFLKAIIKDETLFKKEMNDNLPLILNSILTKDNLFISISCNDSLYSSITKPLTSFIEHLNNGKINNKLEFTPHHINSAFNTPYNVNYCALNFDSKQQFGGERLVVSKILNTDYLWKKVRVLGGAYGARLTIADSGIINMASYRDPNIDQTLDVYKKIPEYLENLNLTKEDVIRYIIGTIGDNYYPKSISTLSSISLMYYKLGKTTKDLIEEKKQILNTSLKDIKDFEKVFENNLNNVSICVVGNKEKIKQTTFKFDEIKQLLK